jgi:UPF0271 protein
MAAVNSLLATAIAEAVHKINPDLILFGLSGSELIRAGEKVGLRTASEVFADRTYQADGTLTPRNQPGALLTDPTQATAQVLGMVKEGKVKAITGEEISLKAETVCIHGDGPHAVEFARSLHKVLQDENILLRAVI